MTRIHWMDPHEDPRDTERHLQEEAFYEACDVHRERLGEPDPACPACGSPADLARVPGPQ